MTLKKQSRIEEEVMGVYRRVNPCMINIDDPKSRARHTKIQKELFNHRLKIPIMTLRNASVLDLGCGTGEVDLILTNWGARVHGVDLNEASIQRAKSLAAKFGCKSKTTFEVGNVLDEQFSKKKYDIVFSSGVIPHVSCQTKLLENMASSLGPSGLLVLAFVSKGGTVQRWLHREIIKSLSQTDEHQIEEFALRYFSEHISRASELGGRSKKSVIYDYLVNPHYHALDPLEIIRFFDEKGIDYYSIWPNIDLPMCVNSRAISRVSILENIYKFYLTFLEFRCLFTQNEDLKVYNSLFGDSRFAKPIIEKGTKLITDLEKILDIKDDETDQIQLSDISHDMNSFLEFTSNYLSEITSKISEKIKNSFSDLEDVLKILYQLRNGEPAPSSFKYDHLFHGYNGVTASYLVFIRS